MDLSTSALILGGLLGCIVAIIHGVLLRAYLTRRLSALLQTRRDFSPPIRRLIVPLIQFSTFAWLTGGLALIAAALWFSAPTKTLVALMVGSQYLFGAVFNLAATRRAHPGWILMTIALIAITVGVWTAG